LLSSYLTGYFSCTGTFLWGFSIFLLALFANSNL